MSESTADEPAGQRREDGGGFEAPLASLEPASEPSTGRRRALVIGATAALLAAGGVGGAIAIGSGGGSHLERLPALAAGSNGRGRASGAQAAVDSKGEMAPAGGFPGWFGTKPTIGTGVVAPATHATAYRLAPTTEQVARLAAAMGVAGTPTSSGTGWVVGSPARLAVRPDGLYQVGDRADAFIDPARDGVVCAQVVPDATPVPCAIAGDISVAGVAGVGVVVGPVRGSGGGAANGSVEPSGPARPGAQNATTSTNGPVGSGGTSGSVGGGTCGAACSAPPSGAPAGPRTSPPSPVPPRCRPVAGPPVGSPNGKGIIPMIGRCADDGPESAPSSPPEATRTAAMQRGMAVLAASRLGGDVSVSSAGDTWSVAVQPTTAIDLPGATTDDLAGLVGGTLLVRPDGTLDRGWGRLLAATPVGSYPLLALPAAIDLWWSPMQVRVGAPERGGVPDVPVAEPAIAPAPTRGVAQGAPPRGDAKRGNAAPPDTGAIAVPPSPVPWPPDQVAATPATVRGVRLGLELAGADLELRLVPAYVLDLGERGAITIAAIGPELTAPPTNGR